MAQVFQAEAMIGARFEDLWEEGYCESFNTKLKDELLNEEKI